MGSRRCKGGDSVSSVSYLVLSCSAAREHCLTLSAGGRATCYQASLTYFHLSHGGRAHDFPEPR